MLLFVLKPACRFESSLFDSRNHISLWFIILSKVLHAQLVRPIAGGICWVFLFFEDGDDCSLLP